MNAPGSGRRLRAGLAAGLVLAVLAVAAAPAAAEYEYVAGQETMGPQDGVCPGFGLFAKSGYYRNEVGRDPRSNESFYLEIRLTYLESFDCAAAFTGVTLTLPAGLALDTSKYAACQRFALSTGATDNRITANCPITPPLLSGSTYSLDPIATNHPEKASFGRRYWFLGYDGSETYREMRILVPVRAPGALNGAPVTFQMKRFDAISPWTSTVGVTTTGAPPPSGGTFTAPQISAQNAPGQFQVSPIGVEIPFSVTKGSANYGVSEFVNQGAALNLGAPWRPCADGQSDFVFDTDQSFLEVQGNFADVLGGPACDLAPSTQFTIEVCAIYRNQANTATLYDRCAVTTLTTPAAEVDVDVTESATDAGSATFTRVLRGAWPAGNAWIRLTRPGQAPEDLPATAVTRGSGALALAGVTKTDLASWQEHSVRGCFDPGPTTGSNPIVNAPAACGPPVTVYPGRLDAPAPGDDAIGATAATFSGIAFRAPNPVLTLQLRVAKAAGVGGQDPGALPVVASQAMPANATPGTTAAPALVASGLAPSTRYAWVVCVEVDGDAAPEDCSPGGGFTTDAAPAGPPPPGGGTPPPGTTPDTTGPTARLKVKGKLKRRRNVTLIVKASDPSGIRSVTIKVGRAKAVAKSRLRVRLPRRKGKLKVVVKVTDNAGNTTRITRKLRIR